MEPRNRAERLFVTGEIARSMQWIHLMWMASRLGIEEHVAIREYGLPPLPAVPESFVYLIGQSMRPPDGE